MSSHTRGSGLIRCCRSTTASTLCRRPSRISPDHRCRRDQTRHGGRRALPGARLRLCLRPARDRASPDQPSAALSSMLRIAGTLGRFAQAPLDQRAGRADEPDHQGSHGEALPLRGTRPASEAPRRLRRRLQLRAPPQDAERFDALRSHLQGMDKRCQTLHSRPTPSNAGTKHSKSRLDRWVKAPGPPSRSRAACPGRTALELRSWSRSASRRRARS